MKILKKALSIIIALSMLLSSVCVFAEEQSEDKTLIYSTEAYNEAGKLLKVLIGEDIFGTEPGAAVSRGQFVYGITKVFGLPGLGKTEPVYSDVAVGHKYFAEICTAYDAGWISAGEKFNPDATIAYSEAIKIVVSAAGYDVVAQSYGGYPSGYMNVATKLGLYDGIMPTREGGLIAADAIVMLGNLMTSAVVDVHMSSGDWGYSFGERIFLEELFDVYRIKGVVTAIGYASVLSDVDYDKDATTIEIDGIEYEYGSVDLDLLGRNVIAYCPDSKDEKRVICVIPGDNEEFELVVEEFIGISGDYLNYERDNRERKVKLDSTYKLIYNGRRTAKLEDYMLDDIFGSIRLLDNDGDSSYDIVFVDSYKYGYLTSVDYLTGYIGIKTPNSYIDLSDEENTIRRIYDADDRELDLFEVPNNVIVAVKASVDKLMYEIKICDVTVEGKITSMKSDKNAIELDDTVYRVSNDFKTRYMDTNLMNFGKIKAAVGLNGELVYLMTSEGDLAYGYLRAVNKETEVFDTKLQVKMFTMDGTMQVFDMAETVTIDDASERNMTNIETACTNNIDKIVKYGLNKNGEINVLDTASTDTSTYGKDTDTRNSLVKYRSGEFQYRGGNKGFGGVAMLGSATILMVPASSEDKDNEEKYIITDCNGLGSGDRYNCDIYDIDQLGMARLVVINYTGTYTTEAAKYNESYVVSTVMRGMSEEGEVGTILECWNKGRFYEYFMPDEVAVNKKSGSGICEGDIVRFRFLKGRISEVFVDYDLSTGVPVFNAQGGGSEQNDGMARLAFIRGKIYNAASGAVVLTGSADMSNFDYTNLYPHSAPSVIALIDTQNKEVRSIKIDELRTYPGYGAKADYAIVRHDYGSAKCMFVIR